MDVGSTNQNCFDYDGSGNIIYSAEGAKGLAEGSDGWLVTKYTWTDGKITKSQTAIGSWTGRVSLSYS